MNESVKSSYDKIADDYTTNRDQFKNDKYLKMLTGRLPAGSSVLDLGCGAGVPIDKYLIDRGFQVTGIDISPRQIELAQQNLPTGEFCVRDMSDLRDGEFHVDAVVSFYAIFHTPREHHLEIFQKINSFLKEGGLLLTTMGASDWEGEEEFHGAPMRWSHYGVDKNIEIVRDAGFETIHVEVDTSGGENHLVVLATKK